MVEGPGCKLKGEKMRAKVLGQKVVQVAGNAVEKRPKSAVRPSPFLELVGREVVDVRTLGKELFIILTGGSCLRVHFLMAGFVRYNNLSEDPDEAARKTTPEQPRLLLELTRDTVALYQCSVEIRDSQQSLERWETMITLDICWPKFNLQRASQIILEERNGSRIVADVLMDQEILPGVGNIIKNEACFDAGINPLTTIYELTPGHVSKLVKMCRDFSALFYNCRKTGKPLHKHYKIYRFSKCKECEGKVTKCKPGEYLRVTYICPSCQTNQLEAGPIKNSLLGWASRSAAATNWSCAVCTLENKPGSVICSACGTSKQKRKPSSEISTSESKKVKVESTFGRAAAKTGGSPKGSPRPQEGAALPATDSHPAPPLPLCKQHRAACVKRTVVKAGPNKGRLFYACSLPRGKECEHFAWADLDHPRCRHGGYAVLREVTQLTPNNGRQFFVCPKNKGQQCNFFQWKTE